MTERIRDRDLLIGLVMTGLYYIAASLIFPGEFGDRADFDEHYMEHRRQVLGAILVCDLIQIAPIAIIRFHDVPARFWFENALQFGGLLTGIASRSKRTNIALLTVLIVALPPHARPATVRRPAGPSRSRRTAGR